MLHGLTRVRGFTQDDAHLFCTPEQLQGEFEQTLDEALRLMKAFGFDDFEYFLSTRETSLRGETDPIAEDAIRKALEKYGLAVPIDEGGGAFYGPKLDINVRDAIGRKWQLGTVQVDFVLPEALRSEVSRRRRQRSHAGDDSPRARGLARTLLRHCSSSTSAARFPPGLPRFKRSSRRSPSISSTMPNEVAAKLRAAWASASTSTKVNEKLGYKIRHWKTQKVPYILVVGKQEAADGTVNVNERGIEAKRTISGRCVRRRTTRGRRGETVKIDLRIAFAGLIMVAAAACSGMSGLDSGGPAAWAARSLRRSTDRARSASSRAAGANAGGPTAGPNGVAELANPGATLRAESKSQYPVADGPTGMKCPQLNLQGQQYNCTFSFNVPGDAIARCERRSQERSHRQPTPSPERQRVDG